MVVLFLTVSLFVCVIEAHGGWLHHSSPTPLAMGTVTIHTVTKIADTNDGVCAADCSLREAVSVALPGSEIRFSALFDSPQIITLTLGTISISKNLTIVGKGARNLTIRRNSTTGNYAIFLLSAFDPSMALVNISGVTIENGSSPGGIQIIGATLTLTSSTIRNNIGIGIFNAEGVLNLNNSTISSNLSYGIYHSAGGSLRCINSTISGNSVRGIYVLDTSTVAVIINSTISDNIPNAQSGASGIFVAQGSVHLRNTIVAANNNNVTIPDVAGTFTSNGNNIIGNRGATTAFNQPGDRTGTSAPLNPLLTQLQNNGGPTNTHALLTGSPAINTGNACVTNRSCPVNNPPTSLPTDQRGPGFPRWVGGVDIGAFESSVPCVYTLSQPSMIDVDARPSVGSFSLSTASGCPWTAMSSAAWLGFTGPANGSGEISIGFNYQGNSTGAVRTASITVGGQQFTVRQSPLTLNVEGVFQNEGNAGITSFTCTVRLSAPWAQTVSVNVSTTTQGSATPGQDYTAASTTLNFSPGQTLRNFVVSVHGDTVVEPNETLFVSITNPSAGVIANGTTISTIVNDDQLTGRRAPFDFDGDNKTDIGIFHPADATWWIHRSQTSSTIAYQFGATTDKIAPADFTGDGKTDIAVWRPSNGEWLILRSEDNSYYGFPFGTNGDIPAPADFDNDGEADPAVFRPSDGFWYILRSTGGVHFELFGTNGDVPVASDYDGDGKADIAIYRPSNGEWWLNRSTLGVRAATFGTATDKPVPGDFTGDGKTDIAFFRPSDGNWYVLRSQDFSYFSFPFGMVGDIPAPGDYDGDGKTDATVFRQATGMWIVNRSTGGTTFTPFGANGDRPVPSAYVP
jgi:CSLREA domain-containing protein